MTNKQIIARSIVFATVGVAISFAFYMDWRVALQFCGIVVGALIFFLGFNWILDNW